MKKSLIAAAAGIVLLASAYGVVSKTGAVDAAEPAASVTTSTEAEYSIVVNGSKLQLDSRARLSGSTMLVPARNIAEALGAVVTYEAETETITAVKEDITVIFRIGSVEAVKNGSTITLGTAPVKDESVTMVPVRFFSETFGTVVKWNGDHRRVNIDHESALLPAVGTIDNLKELLKKSEGAGIGYGGTGVAVMAGSVAAEAKSAAPAAPAPGSARDMAAPTSNSAAKESNDYSTTNVQVQGVDEADVVKTDGEYIYQVNREKVVIARAYPAGEMSLISTINLSERKIQPLELYVDGNRLIVIGASYESYQPVDGPSIMPAAPSEKKMMIARPQKTTVKTVIYDITSRDNPKAVKEVETEGSYVTSRKIGAELYVIANQYLNRYSILNEQAEPAAPSYRDSAVSGEFIKARYDDIRYFPDSVLDSYMLIAGIDTERPQQKANVSVYLGSAQNVYASSKNLYVSVTQQKLVPDVQQQNDGNSSSMPVKDIAAVHYELDSVVYKFLMEQGDVRFTAKGEVPGTVLNQFSMDEHEGYFRIATTKGDMWRNDKFTSKNNLYILDESMAIKGKIEDIAPGERIYSVRFMGGRGYMVTFKKVDPLFVLDLADPANPSILGKLKIPGYSDYLHPYDENHLIGFGKDTIELANEWERQQGVAAPSTTAFYQGMKVAMFDVTDVANPKELFKADIGDRGTDSELLRNHKALLFSKDKNLLAFPVTVMKVPEGQGQVDRGIPAYGQFAFQGAYIYNIDLVDGFKLRGTVTHLTEEEQAKAGAYGYGGTRNVERILYIGDTLYTLSQSQIRANDLESLQEKKRLELP